VRVVIAEDLALLRDGLIRILESFDFEVVEAVDNGPALLRALTSHRPEVAVVDVRLPPTFTDEGLQAAIEARRQIPGSSSPIGTARSAICSRTAFPMSRSSSMRYDGLPPAVPRWIPT
jgi:DNA-binding NarL/FixJ family response regulator